MMPGMYSQKDLQGLTFVQGAISAAALQLLPENATSLVRLQHLATAMVALVEGRATTVHITPKRLKSIVALSQVNSDELVMMEDPYNDTYVYPVSFHGGDYLLCSGGGERAVSILSDVIDAAFSESDEALPPNFVQRAGFMTQVLLTLSDIVLKRSGLQRWEEPRHDKRRLIFVPDRDRLERVVTAVQFTVAELAESTGIDSDLLDRLCVDPESIVDLKPHPDVSEPLIERPLLRFGDKVIVVNPVDFSSSIRLHLLRIAQEEHCLAILAKNLRVAATFKADEVLRLAGFERAGSIVESKGIVAIPYSFDGKSAHAVIVTDPLSDYDVNHPFGMWNTGRVRDELRKQIESIDQRSCEAEISELVMVVMAGIGRPAMLPVPRMSADNALLLFRAAWEIDLIAEFEDRDALRIWYFAKARRDFHENVRVQSFETLDEYAIFRMRESSFYLSDERPPDVASIVPSSAFEEVQLYLSRNDKHSILDPETRMFVPVRRWDRSTSAPIYMTDLRARYFGYACEMNKFTAWFVPGIENDEVEDAGEFLQLAEACCQWLWQLLLKMDPPSSFPQVILKIVVVRSQSSWWATRWEGERPSAATAVDVTVDEQRIVFRFGEAFAKLASSSRDADIAVVHALLAVVQWTWQIEFAEPDEFAKELTSPPRQLIQSLHTPNELHLLRGALKPGRLIIQSMSAFILDRIGKWLTAECREPIGIIPVDQRTKILNRVVEFCFNEIVRIVSSLSPVLLIEKLVENCEAVMRASFEHQRMLPRHVAFFGVGSGEVDRADEQSRKLNNSATASRFLIEYVAAQPPTGERPITNEVIDELMALAVELISRALLSDAINYKLANPEVSILESGRLGVDKADRYYEATAFFSVGRAEKLVRDAMSVRAIDVSDGGFIATEPERRDLDAAAVDEFGFGFDDLASVTITLWRAAYERGGASVSMAFESVVDLVVAGTDISRDRAVDILKSLSIKPREDYFAGLGPEVYPWRYNRSMSYLRRPLICAGAEQDTVIWGMRNVYMSGPYLLDLCMSARLKAKTSPMKAIIGRLRNRITAHFVKLVADAMPENCRTLIGVEKFGSRRMERSKGQPLGDIDVLVVDPVSECIYFLEVKDFEVARTPVELSNEVEKLVLGKSSAMVHHAERMEWIQENVVPVLKGLGVDPTRKWKLVARVVVSEMLVTTFLHDCIIPVKTLQEFIEEVNDARVNPERPRSTRARRR